MDIRPQVTPTLFTTHFRAALEGAALPVCIAALVSLYRTRRLREDLDALATRVLELETILEAERVLGDDANAPSPGDTTTPPGPE